MPLESEPQNHKSDEQSDPEFYAGPEYASRKKSNVSHLPMRERLARVTWSWYPITMSTGSLASLLSSQPFTFRGLQTIGKIFFIVQIVLFLLITTLIAYRFFKSPRSLTHSLHHPSESFFFGAFWVSIALILYNSEVYGTPNAGSWLPKALRVVYWIYYGCQMLVAIFQYHVIFDLEKLPVSESMPAWILPAYPFLVTGTVSAALSKSQPAKSALQMIIAGVIGQGLGWILAFLVYTIYFTRLINSSMPGASSRPGMYVAVGPAAYTCAGLIALGQQAKNVVPSNYLGVSSDIAIGEIWYAISVLTGLFIWLFAVWFSAVTTLFVLRSLHNASFSLQWWAYVFPNAGLAIATIQVGNALQSDGIRWFASVLTIILVALWLLCAVVHIRALCKHEVLAIGKDPGIDDEEDDKEL